MSEELLRQRRLSLIAFVAQRATIRARIDWPEVHRAVNALCSHKRAGLSEKAKAKHEKALVDMSPETVQLARRYISLSTAIPAKRKQVFTAKQEEETQE